MFTVYDFSVKEFMSMMILHFIAKCCFLFPFTAWLSIFWFRRLEYTVCFVYVINSLFTLLFYAADKRNAERGEWRIPENCLHCWELFHGWPGALLGQKLFHHKHRKVSFMLVFWLCVCMNITVTVFVLYKLK